MTGAARYSARDDIYVKFDLSAEILSHDDIGGEVSSWSFSFNRNDKFLLQIGSYNYKDVYFNLSLHRTNDSYTIPANSSLVLSLKHDEGKSTPGYPFGQDVPNNMDFNVIIEDGNGHWQSFKVNVPFSYTPF